MYINPVEKPFQRIAETAKRKSASDPRDQNFVETLEGVVAADAVEVAAMDSDEKRERGEREASAEAKPESPVAASTDEKASPAPQRSGGLDIRA